MRSGTASSSPRTMVTPVPRTDLRTVLRRAARPPVREVRFWIIQLMVLCIAGVHMVIDLQSSAEGSAVSTGLPVALLIVPVGYAAMRYGLAGSAATAAWAVLLWLPDMLLPHDRGHVASDAINLGLVVVVAIVFGQRIESERLAHARVEEAHAESLVAERRYRRLFESNRSPILVLDPDGRISDANPAAHGLLGDDVVGRRAGAVLDGVEPLGAPVGQFLTVDGRDYRLGLVSPPTGAEDPFTQLVLEDVTEERSEGRRATRYAQLVVQAEEDQRRRLSRELHDEPLQLFLHLARRLEHLGTVAGVPSSVVDGLFEARLHALDAADRLRSLARDLRPPALDQLGLLAALSSLVADVGDRAVVVAQLVVLGDETRLDPEVELGAFRIVEEAVRNAVQHAEASQLVVTVEYRTDELVLAVSDDGRGFDPSEVGELAPGHLGLVGMRERARLVGGHLELRARPGAGTTVEAAVPRCAHEPGGAPVRPSPLPPVGAA